MILVILAVLLTGVAGFSTGRLVRGMTISASPQLTDVNPLKRAADLLEADSNWSFTAVQETWFVRRSDSPPFVSPDPSSSTPPQSLLPGEDDQRRFESIFVSKGFVRGAEFFDEIRGGYEPGDDLDFDKGFVSAIVMLRDGQAWRNDGDGWQATDVLPGHGMDPLSAALLPDLLRSLRGVQQDKDNAALFVGFADPAYYPGVIAPDGLLFTASPVVVQVEIDGEGRMIRLTAEAINLNRDEVDLVTTTIVTFDYSGSDDSLPTPSPLATEPGVEP